MSRLILVLIFLTYSRLSGNDSGDIVPIRLSDPEEARPVRVVKIDELRKNQSISIRNLIKEIGNPLNFAEYGDLGSCLAYKGSGDAIYLFSVTPNGSEGGDHLLDTHEVAAIILWLDPNDPEELFELWDSSKGDVHESDAEQQDEENR